MLGIEKKFGTRVHHVTQSAEDFIRPRYGTAFKEWQYKLKRGDKLPRGKWFKGKTAGRPRVIFDEAWRFRGQN